MAFTQPNDVFRWAHLNEEHWVHAVCGRSSVSNGRHIVRIHRKFGPIFCHHHHYPWSELATIGLLQDSTIPGCPGLAVVWSGQARFVNMRHTDTHADRINRMQVDFTQGEFRRSLLIEGAPLGLFFFWRLLKERLQIKGEI